MCVCVSACSYLRVCVQCPLMSSWNCTKLLHVLIILHRSRMFFLLSAMFSQKFSMPSLHYFLFWLCVRLACGLSFPWPCILVCVCVPAFVSPPNATAHKMIEKCFEHNAYLCVHRQARAVNKLNMQIILFSPSVSNKVYLSKNPIIPDNYYPECSLEVSMLTDHSSQHGNSTLLTHTHLHAYRCVVSTNRHPAGFLLIFFLCSVSDNFCTFKHFVSSLDCEISRFFLPTVD